MILKSWHVCDWLAKWLIILACMDLRRSRVSRRSNVGLVESALQQCDTFWWIDTCVWYHSMYIFESSSLVCLVQQGVFTHVWVVSIEILPPKFLYFFFWNSSVGTNFYNDDSNQSAYISSVLKLAVAGRAPQSQMSWHQSVSDHQKARRCWDSFICTLKLMSSINSQHPYYFKNILIFHFYSMPLTMCRMFIK